MLCHYAKCFAEFCYGRNAAFDEACYHVGKACGLPDDEFEAKLHAFHELGRQEDAPLMDPTGPAALKRLKQFGFDVVVLTARPLWTYPRMLLETVRWLNTNCIPFDGVILSVQKPHYVGQGIIIEDNSDNVRALLKGGAYVYVVNRPYNQDLPPHPQMIRVSSLNEAAREIIELTERLK